jgi:ribonucleoside-diphosphate reductase alpha chain
MYFEDVRSISKPAIQILQKRYFLPEEKEWKDIVKRVIDTVLVDCEDKDQKNLTHEMILNRYFVPNSPCLVNSGKKNGGLAACFVVDFPDTIEGIYETKFDFARIARKGGGCGTTLSKIRPEGSIVNGSAHGYAGGPVKFADTISHDMTSLTQAGFREMAIMFTISVYHPDILRFIQAKEIEGRISNANISVVVDNAFMEKVKKDESYWTEFDGEKYQEYKAKDIFNLIVEGAWKNGEPGILFYDRMNDSPYKYSKQEILATNPCGEQPLPFNATCNLGAIDISKLITKEGILDLKKFEVAIRLGIRFLDQVIEQTSYPTEKIEKWSMENRPVGLGIMGLSDYYLIKEVAYGSEQSLEDLSFILDFMYKIAEDESITLGEEYGVPKACKKLPVPRRNITLLTIAPTGTTSIIAGCTSGIEPVFSEIVIRNDKTGTYVFAEKLADKPYFRCAVSANGAQEVTWEEHVKIQATAQKYVDSGVSKTINFPTMTHRETIYNSFMLAWELGCKGLTVYRNMSRKNEVLTPKNIKKSLCPVCGKELIEINKIKKCSDPTCGFILKEFPV